MVCETLLPGPIRIPTRHLVDIGAAWPLVLVFKELYSCIVLVGPMRINGDYSMSSNTNLSWNTVADYVWVDQPVGTGFSTADETGYSA